MRSKEKQEKAKDRYTHRLTSTNLNTKKHPWTRHACQYSSIRIVMSVVLLSYIPPNQPTSIIVLTITIILLRLLHSLHLYTPCLLPLLVPRGELVLPTVPQILECKLLSTAERLDVSNPIQRSLQELFKPGFATDLIEGSLHGNRVGADHGVAVDSKDAEFVVLPDKVAARHDEARAVQRELG